MNGMVALRARRVITPLQDLRDAIVLVEGDKIVSVGLEASIPVPSGAKVIDVGDRLISPGFIDLHHHGALGVYAAEGAAAVQKIGKYLATTGTTSWLPTSASVPGVDMVEGIKGMVQAMHEGTGGAEPIGIHMEGPFLAPKRIPGQEVVDRALMEPSLDEFHRFMEASEGNIKIMGVAPELKGALEVISEIRRTGVVAAVAHTKGTYEQFVRAVEAGARHVTHTYNVMTGFHHRRPGVVGGALTCDQVTAELIADGYHVSPVAMDVLLRCRGFDNVAVITDNVPLAGLPDGEYEMFGRHIVKKNGISRLAGSRPDQDNTMAGSEWPMNRNLHVLVDRVGVPLRDAIRMATLTPATIIDADNRKGSLEPGKDADLVVIDEDVNVYLAMVRGEIVYEKK
jgi:N-acetylglucosamine-6-phosphate deacetylase